MKHLLTKVRSQNRRERGVVIIWIAFFMLTMLGFVALGIDVAKVMATRTELQNAADAAALAGASAINAKTGVIQQDVAIGRAQTTSAENKAFVNQPLPVQLLGADVSFPTPTQCTVIVRREAGAGGEMVTHVAQVLGIKSMSLTATATAEASIASGVCTKLAPMGAIPPGNDPTYFKPGCGMGPTGGGYTLIAGQGGSVTGNYQALDFPSCDGGGCGGYATTGANTYRCLLANGYDCCVKTGDVLTTEPGNMAGPTRQGLQDLWDSDTDRRSGICYENYTGNGARVVNVPIITALPNGRSTVTVLAFASFFLLQRPTGGPSQPVTGEFIDLVVPGIGGGTKGTSFSLRLVK
jgi:Flp pilus assembly protein TadG